MNMMSALENWIEYGSTKVCYSGNTENEFTLTEHWFFCEDIARLYCTDVQFGKQTARGCLQLLKGRKRIGNEFYLYQINCVLIFNVIMSQCKKKEATWELHYVCLLWAQ